MSLPTEVREESNTKIKKDWQPRVIAFLCNWCSYAGADLAGTSRLRYDSHIEIIRVPCSGRVDPLFILKCFEKGADGVLVSGCHPGDCHYATGNYYARRKFASFRKLLEFCGFDLRRIHFSWVSSAESTKFVSVVKAVTEAVKALGPNARFTRKDDKAA